MTATAYDVIVAELPALLPRLWRYGLVLSRDPIAAEDLVQATCLRALERSSQFAVGTTTRPLALFDPAFHLDQSAASAANSYRSGAWSTRKMFSLLMASGRSKRISLPAKC